ncbi:MAG: ATP-binding cassette domain-containing protein [Acidimicrobiia bacterium]|nr:ATP-binding cassette domain-containing protein [Acidimicrobiia bacterium]
MTEATETQVTPRTASPVIVTRELNKSYLSDNGEVRALENVSLEVERGEIVALLGPSGCGKSTLLDILAGLTPKTSGEVEVNGEGPKPQPEVGIMFQQALLFPWRTVAANVLLPSELINGRDREWKERAEELLTLVGLEGWSDRYHWELSGGMQQRVALARVLLLDPEILLLDEPFGALDEMTRESLDTEMMRIAADTRKTVLLVTHNVYEATLMADRIFVFTARPGRIAGVVEVDEAQPRDIAFSTSSLFGEKVAQVRDLLSSGSEK